MTKATNKNGIISRTGSPISIRKPLNGGSSINNFGSNWVTAGSLSRRWREVYRDEDLIGFVEKQDGDWWAEMDGGCSCEIKGGLRDFDNALAQVEASLVRWHHEHQHPLRRIRRAGIGASLEEHVQANGLGGRVFRSS